MIDIKEVEKEIEKLENKDTSSSICEKLAILYIVRDHLKENYKEYNHMISNDMKIDNLSLK